MISKVIRIEDIVKADELHVKQKYSYQVEFIDLEVRNAFLKHKVLI